MHQFREFTDIDMIEERDNDIKKLYNNDLIQINDIMNTMSTLVNNNTQHINDLNQKTEQTNEHVKSARDEINKASELHKNTMCIIS